jgi:NAD(P)H-dependent FMN reductase
MTRIIGLSGSLRTRSYNTALLEAAAVLMPETVELELASIRGIPLYDADLEASDGLPAPVVELKERIASADALLIATPEYNHSIPGVAKNAIDWLSRPPRDIRRVFGDLSVALIGATPGRGGTMLSQSAWLPVLRTLGTRTWFGRSLYVSGASTLFDETGLRDSETRARLETFCRDFATFVEANPRVTSGLKKS